MGWTFTASPTSGTQTDGTVTLSVEITHDSFIIDSIDIRYRVNGSSWTTVSKSGYTTTLLHEKVIYLLGGGDYVEWGYSYAYHYEGSSGAVGYNAYSFWTARDATGPVISSRVPADAATIYPGASGCQFTATVADDFFVDNTKLYVDADVLKDTESGSATSPTNAETFYATGLTKGAHTWYLKATDVAGNITTSSTYNVTVGNVVPGAPGTPTVGSGLTTVADEVEYTVSWTAATDYNTEDTLTYKLEENINAGGWAQVAAGIAGLTQVWTPHEVGTAALRVSATDGTGYGAVSATRTVTVSSTSPPNNPTLTIPNGTETWTEGDTQTVTWTKASPEHPDGLTCTYELQFSADGTFTDAVSIVSGLASTTSYSWSLPATLVVADTATCKVRVRSTDTNGRTSAWDASDAGFDVIQNTVPTVTLVTPTDAGIIEGTAPVFYFAVADVDLDAVHIELQVSNFADFRSAIVSTASATDFANWEEAATPYDTWTTMGSGGAASGNRVRYTAGSVFRYDLHYGRVRVNDSRLVSAWTEFTFTVSADTTVPLSVVIGGNTYKVTALTITELTGGDPSPITLELPLDDYVATPLEEGDAVAISSGLGGHARTWNATVETITRTDNLVSVFSLQDDVYLSRKLATGNEASADLGQNLADFVTSYGSPLDGDNIDLTILASIALTGGYKNLREHFADAMAMAPNYLLWVDSAGSVHFVAQADLTAPVYELYEETPS